MQSVNKVFLMGNIVRDLEVRYTTSGSAVCNFSIAVNRNWKDKTGEEKKEVSFIGIVVFGKVAENCGKYLSKGSPVFIEGRLKTESYEEEGKKISKTKVYAENVQFLGQKKEDSPQVEVETSEEKELIWLEE